MWVLVATVVIFMLAPVPAGLLVVVLLRGTTAVVVETKAKLTVVARLAAVAVAVLETTMRAAQAAAVKTLMALLRLGVAALAAREETVMSLNEAEAVAVA